MSDSAAGIASVLIVAEAERGEAERLVGAHCASVNDKDPVASVLIARRLAQPVIAASGREAGDFCDVSSDDDFPDPPAQVPRLARPFSFSGLPPTGSKHAELGRLAPL